VYDRDCQGQKSKRESAPGEKIGIKRAVKFYGI